MNLEDRYVHLDGLSWFPLDGGTSFIVRSIEADKFYRMQKDGKRIYELIDGSRSVNDIITLICKEDNLEKDKATEEITKFLKDLLEVGLILPVDEIRD
jgi:hypothetical protein